MLEPHQQTWRSNHEKNKETGFNQEKKMPNNSEVCPAANEGVSPTENE
jgi:hypothetical protein